MLTPIAWFWAASLMPDRFSVMEMGRVDHGGATSGNGHHHSGHGDHGRRSVTSFVVDEDRQADVVVDLVARQELIKVGGRSIPGYTLNGKTPGPLITAVEGDLVEVRIHNESVSSGVTLHWHGIDVPNAVDGVAGVTQDAVAIGEDFSYRFIADHAGSYWYHSHQVSNAQVAGGLFGPLVIQPERSVPTTDVLAVAHTYGGIRTINGKPGDLRVDAEPGDRLRLRVINTDNGPVQVWSSAPYRLLAIDGRELHEPQMITGRSVGVGAGARADLELTVPTGGSPPRVQVGASTAVIIGAGTAPAVARPSESVDLITYGTAAGPLIFDPTRADRRFDYVIGQRPGFVRGKPGFFWSINGHLYPDVPMFVVREGDVVVMTIKNGSGEVHPMHLHGHHAVVLSRNGVPSRGTPWWFDSLDVGIDETYVIAFVADNPGIWMDHCHNLKHAADGMVAHLMYEGVTTPFMIGGTAANRPE